MNDYVSTDLAGAAYLAQMADDGLYGDLPSRSEYDDWVEHAMCPYTGEPCPRAPCADAGCDIEREEEITP